MALTLNVDNGRPPTAAGGHWVWDDNERGIVFVSHDAFPSDTQNRARDSRSKIYRASPGCLLASLDITFLDVVDALGQIRFKRHCRRRVEPGEPDVVTLRDIKDVVLYQVQQPLPAEFFKLFHTPAVDRFLRALILYCFYYIQTWEQLTNAELNSANKIREPGLRPTQREQRDNLSCLRALLARDYHTLLLGHGPGITRKFHHMSNGIQSWSQRDARIWELLLRMAVRVTWVALQRRYLNVIDAEVGRLFRGDSFNTAARKQHQNGYSKVRPVTRNPADVREAVLHSASESEPRSRQTSNTLFSCSPVTSEILGGEHSWMLLGLGRLPQPSWCERFRALENAYTKPEEEIVRVHGMFIGILGMPRSNLDTMLTIRDKQRRQEASIPAGSTLGQHTYKSLLPDSEEPKTRSPTSQGPLCLTFPFSSSSQ